MRRSLRVAKGTADGSARSTRKGTCAFPSCPARSCSIQRRRWLRKFTFIQLNNDRQPHPPQKVDAEIDEVVAAGGIIKGYEVGKGKTYVESPTRTSKQSTCNSVSLGMVPRQLRAPRAQVQGADPIVRLPTDTRWPRFCPRYSRFVRAA
jgi:hypothetical protein